MQAVVHGYMGSLQSAGGGVSKLDGMREILFSNVANQRTTLQVAFSGLQSMATAGSSILGGVMLASLGADRRAYLIVFAASAVARLAAVSVLVTSLPQFRETVASVRGRLRDSCPTIVVGGRAFGVAGTHWRDCGADAFAADVREALRILG